MTTNVAAVFRRLTLGVYVAGVAQGCERDAFTAAAIAQASYEPLMLSMAINPQHASYPLLLGGETFAVSVLGKHQIELARHFGTQTGDHVDKLQGVAWRPGCRGAPILEIALAYFDCIVTADMPAGDHRIVLGRVVAGALRDPEAVPLLYAQTKDLDGSAALYPDQFPGP
jgi:flavin reductase (DIM6/NTAB) family NADH-FMN oxidoreductase RutF